MKELSVKEKAQRYDEAIEQLRTMMPNWENLSYNGKTFLQDLVHIIPELKESEDEQIRKDLIVYLRSILSNKKYGDKFIEGWIAWLEKRRQTFTKKDVDDAYLKGVCDAKQELEKQGEKQDNVCDKELSEILGRVIRRYINDPNIPYTEREKVSMEIIPYVERLEKQGEQQDVSIQINPSEYINDMGGNGCYLKNTTQTSTWSEEDEKEVAVLEAYIRSKDWSEKYVDRALGIVDELVNKIKSLKSQSHWKPSEEQMKLLREVQQALLGKDCHNRFVNFMYELKRLREE